LDEEDLAAGRTLDCPTLVLWGEFYLTGRDEPGSETALDVWRRTFAPQAQGQSIDSGHFLAEERPTETARALSAFLTPTG
ncbi:MAG: alpha/beta hydrolase, partial [Salinarimonadaceae bacterium]